MAKKVWLETNDDLYVLACVLQCNVVFFRVYEDTSRGIFYILPKWGLFTYSLNWIPILEGFEHFHALGVPIEHRNAFNELMQKFYNHRDNSDDFIKYEIDFDDRIREWWDGYSEYIKPSTQSLSGFIAEYLTN
jgi:hypothetical protein